MKRKLISIAIAALTFTSAAHAIAPGAYMGAGAGYAVLGKFQHYTRNNDGGIGGKVFAGLNFNQFFGIETGYVYFPKNSYTSYYHHFSYTEKAITLMAKGYIPLDCQNRFNLSLGLGAAQTFNTLHIHYRNSNYRASRSKNFVLPAASIGASYRLNDKLTLSAESMGIAKKDATYNTIASPAANLLSLNLIYNF